MKKLLIISVMVLFALGGYAQKQTINQAKIDTTIQRTVNKIPACPPSGLAMFYYRDTLRGIDSTCTIYNITKLDVGKAAGIQNNVQYNMAGKLGADTSFFYDPDMKWLWVPTVMATDLLAINVSTVQLNASTTETDSAMFLVYHTTPANSIGFRGQIWVKTADERLRYTNDGGTTYEATLPNQTPTDSLKILGTNGNYAAWINNPLYRMLDSLAAHNEFLWDHQHRINALEAGGYPDDSANLVRWADTLTKIATKSDINEFGTVTEIGAKLDTTKATYDMRLHWTQAYGWGNHAGLYTPIAHKTTEDAINGILKINGAGTYSAVTDNSSSWNTAYGWGNHAAAGYASTTLMGAKLDTTNATYAMRLHWNTAYGWGNHAGLYSPLALKTTLDAVNGLIKGNGAGGYSAITDNSTNWNSAYTYRFTSASGTAPLTLSLASNGLTGSIANAAADGSTKGAAAFNANDFDAASGVVALDYTNAQAADASHKGMLTSADYLYFYNKLGAPANNVWNTSKDYAGNTFNSHKVTQDNTQVFGGTVEIGALHHPANAGLVNVVNMPVTQLAVNGREYGYMFKLGGQNWFKMYGTWNAAADSLDNRKQEFFAPIWYKGKRYVASAFDSTDTERAVSMAGMLAFGNSRWGGGSGSGEINTASNLGTGLGVFKTKSTYDLQFKSFTVPIGSKISLTNNTNDISIDVDLSGKEDFGTASGLFSTHNSTYNHLNIAHGETAYTWGNHAGLYTPIAHKTTEDAINGIVKINGAGTYSAVTDNSSNWNTAYGWGNHASAGYSTTTQLGAKLDTTNATYLNRYHWNLAYGWGNHAAAGYIGSPVNNAWYLTKDAAGNSANLVKKSGDNTNIFSGDVEIGALHHAANSGLVNILNMPVTSLAADNSVHGYRVKIGSQEFARISGQYNSAADSLDEKRFDIFGAISASNLSGSNTGDQTLSGLGGVPTGRKLTINGTQYDLSADRSWSLGTVTSVAPGVGMDFTTFNGSGSIAMGTPSALNPSTANSATGTTHTHQVTGFYKSDTTAYADNIYSKEINIKSSGLNTYPALRFKKYVPGYGWVNNNLWGIIGDYPGNGTGNLAFYNYILGEVGFYLSGSGDAVFSHQLKAGTIYPATTDLDAFLVDSAGYLKQRTGAQVLSDIGAAPASTVTFPGFGTSHTTSAYGDHAHATTYATVTLNNLGTTAINTHLLPYAGGLIDLGSSDKPFNFVYISSSATPSTKNVRLQASPSGLRIASFPDKDGTVAMTSDIPAVQIQSDWIQATNTALDYIKNKPTLGTAAATASTDYTPIAHKTTEDAINGILKINGAGVYSAVTDNSANWNKYNQWDGNSIGLTAATGRTSLGLGSAAVANLGTGASDAAYGNHAHSGTYEPVIAADGSSKYWRSDKTWQPFPTFNQNTSGTAAGLSATLVVGSGGTGLPSVTAGSYLKGNGSSALVPRTTGEVRADLGLEHKSIVVQVYSNNEQVAVADGVAYVSIPHGLDGWTISNIQAHSFTGTSGNIGLLVYNSGTAESTSYSGIFAAYHIIYTGSHDSKSNTTALPVYNLGVVEGCTLMIDVKVSDNSRYGLDVRIDFTR